MRKQLGRLFFRRRDNTLTRHAVLDKASMDSGSGAGMAGQRGRSMIEMLGVLAIIGVLSIGGIALYRRVVNNHQANTILDDANRLAFVITERGNFPVNDNIVGIEFNQTSPYSIVPFVGQRSGQYGIMVENVPKGVCEPLVDKASVEYKVRVMPYNSTEFIDQIADTGLVYDSYHKDICINDVNDVVLFFGNTSAQCNKPEEGEDYTKCNRNADCCGTHFWAFENLDVCPVEGPGTCRLVSDYGTGTGDDTKTVNGQKFIRSSAAMSWWSAENWCKQQNMEIANRDSLGCKHVAGGNYCTEFEDDAPDGGTSSGLGYNGSVLRLLQTSPSPLWRSGYYWIDNGTTGCYTYFISLNDSHINYADRRNSDHILRALCK